MEMFGADKMANQALVDRRFVAKGFEDHIDLKPRESGTAVTAYIGNDKDGNNVDPDSWIFEDAPVAIRRPTQRVIVDEDPELVELRHLVEQARAQKEANSSAEIEKARLRAELAGAGIGTTTNAPGITVDPVDPNAAKRAALQAELDSLDSALVPGGTGTEPYQPVGGNA